MEPASLKQYDHGGGANSLNKTRAWRGDAETSVTHPAREQGLFASKADIFLPGHFSGELAKAYAKRGILALSCDYRACEWGGGLHVRGDVRELLYAQPWKIIIASMPCQDIAQCDTIHMDTKLDDGRAWFGMLLNIYVMCAAAQAVAIELPSRTLLNKFWQRPFQTIDLWEVGAKWRKPTAFRLRNLPPLTATHSCSCPENLPSLPQSVIIKGDPEARERARSRFVPELAKAIAEQWEVQSITGDEPALCFERERAALKRAFEAEGHTVPTGWDEARAKPPMGDKAAARLSAETGAAEVAASHAVSRADWSAAEHAQGFPDHKTRARLRRTVHDPHEQQLLSASRQRQGRRRSFQETMRRASSQTGGRRVVVNKNAASRVIRHALGSRRNKRTTPKASTCDPKVAGGTAFRFVKSKAQHRGGAPRCSAKVQHQDTAPSLSIVGRRSRQQELQVMALQGAIIQMRDHSASHVHRMTPGQMPENGAVYIGRPSKAAPGCSGKWGNYASSLNELKSQGRSTEEAHMLCVCLYAVELLSDEARCKEARQLTDKHLHCWCSPRLCHGHVLAAVAAASDRQLTVWRRTANGVSRAMIMAKPATDRPPARPHALPIGVCKQHKQARTPRRAQIDETARKDTL